MMNSLCIWCGTAFEPRSNGGSAQRFCSKDCRQDFNTACRIWAAAECEAERVSIFELRTCLEQRARSLGCDRANTSHPEASQAQTRPEGRQDAALCQNPKGTEVNDV